MSDAEDDFMCDDEEEYDLVSDRRHINEKLRQCNWMVDLIKGDKYIKVDSVMVGSGGIILHILPSVVCKY